MLDAPTPRWSRYVAIGDSFTEGLWDDPDGREAPQRGWADLLASHLSARRSAAGEPQLEYANLAIRGRLLRPILVEQVPAALALGPDLVSLVGGGNDLLRPGADVDRMARNLEAAASGSTTPSSGPWPAVTAPTSWTCGACAPCATGGCGPRTAST